MRMTFPRGLRAASALCIIAILVACDTRPPSPYTGAVYFGNGAYLMRLGLQTGELSVAGHLGNTVIRDVSPYSGDYLLIAETASLNRQRVPRIAWFNRRTGEKGDFYGGVRARLLATAGVMVYDDGGKVFAVPQEDRSDNTLIFSHPGATLTAMVEASPGLLLMETVEANRFTIRAWDAGTGELRELAGLAATCRLDGAVWIDAMERLACPPRQSNPATAAYRLANLDGEDSGELELPGDQVLYPVAYIDSQRALVLQEKQSTLFGDKGRFNAWLYAIDTGELTHLADDVNLGRSVAYAAH